MNSFYARSDPKRAKNTVKPSIFFALLRSLCMNAALKMLVKSTQGVNFNNILQAAFVYRQLFAACSLAL